MSFQFFLFVFTVEAALKMIGLGVFGYFKDGWNRFDFIIVVFGLCELGLEGVQGLSLLRSLRLVCFQSSLASLPKITHLCSHLCFKLRPLRLVKRIPEFDYLLTRTRCLFTTLSLQTFSVLATIFIFTLVKYDVGVSKCSDETQEQNCS